MIVDRREEGEPRYSLLETVRQYARDRLKDAGELAAARERHAAEFAALAERAHAGRITEEDRWSAVLEAEHENLRAALDLLRASDPERHLEMAGALAWFWLARSYLFEGHEQLTAALAATPRIRHAPHGHARSPAPPIFWRGRGTVRPPRAPGARLSESGATSAMSGR